MNRFLLGCLAAWLIPTSLALAQPAPTADGATTAPLAPPPGEIPWVTNLDDPPIGSLEAIKGGTFNTFMYDYPLTFRLMGPNSNDAFAAWNRAYTMSFTLLQRHPVTDNYIPWMASHWAVMPDNRTVYYKLRPEARWTDGEPVTADDYVFAWEMMGSEAIVDPFYNEYVATYFESVEALDDLTLKVVGKQPSWRPLDDYALFPMPRHAIDLGPDWVQRANNTFQVAAGPYRVTEAITGKHVVFDKVPGWWGADLDYFRGLYNVDRIVVHVIPDGRELDYFKQQQIDMTLVASARIWAEETDFPAIQNGWAHKKRVFVDTPQ
ncbi:MAG TPA: ABC transporter substrate-binding protein, partial [Candidatus Sumerlaeota bacterium]|nr:ABC transporter substrate-binding protein [Candidatus Sumerlaeota bacterium]